MGGSRTESEKKMSDAEVYKTVPVIVKFIQVMVGIVCTGIAGSDLTINFSRLSFRSGAVITGENYPIVPKIVEFVTGAFKPMVNLESANNIFIDQMTCRIVFLAVSVIFLTISVIQLTWFPASLFRGQLKSRIISGVIYHLVGFGLHIAASVSLLMRIDYLKEGFFNFEMMRPVAIIGFSNAGLYLLSFILALWSFTGNKTHSGILPLVMRLPPKY